MPNRRGTHRDQISNGKSACSQQSKTGAIGVYRYQGYVTGEGHLPPGFLGWRGRDVVGGAAPR
jgi:hypothetical protein